MIKLTKGEEPDLFKQIKRKYKMAMDEYYFNPDIMPRPKFNIRGIKSNLLADFNHKCVYCETKHTEGVYLDIEHYRPKGMAVGDGGKIGKLKGYYTWLMYEWDNLFLACKVCNLNKSNIFEVSGERYSYEGRLLESFITSRIELNRLEKPLFIDPLDDNPEDFFYYDELGNIYPNKEGPSYKRAKYTINLLNLNRSALVESRRRVVQSVLEIIDTIESLFSFDHTTSEKLTTQQVEFLKTYLFDSSEEHSGIARFFILNKINDSQFLKKILLEKSIITQTKLDETETFFDLFAKIEESNSLKLLKDETKEIRIEEIYIKNFRGIKDLTIPFPNETDNWVKENNFGEYWLNIIGENGVGKTTILKVVAACLSHKKNWKKYIKFEDFIDDGVIQIKTDLGDTFICKDSKANKSLRFEKIRHNTPVLAYGAIRLNRKDLSKYNYEENEISTISNLFDPSKPLIDSESWLYERCDESKFLVEGDFEEKLMTFIGLENGYGFRQINTESKKSIEIFKKSDNSIFNKFEHLSTGYKQQLNLVCDIISNIRMRMDSIEATRGIVLIDEIENHLHPKWKLQFVSKLRNMFPTVQFIVTTHDPLCLKGMNEGEVVLLEKDKDDNLVKRTDLINPGNLKIDQMLTSDFFGLSTTLDPEIELIYNEYYDLKLKKNSGTWDTEEEKRYNELQKNLRDNEFLGSSYRDELFYGAVDYCLAKNRIERKPKNEIQVEINNRISDIWNTLD